MCGLDLGGQVQVLGARVNDVAGRRLNKCATAFREVKKPLAALSIYCAPSSPLECAISPCILPRRIASVLQSMLPVYGLRSVLPIYVFLKPSIGIKCALAALFRVGEPALRVLGLACEVVNAGAFFVPVRVRADRGMAEEEQRPR